MRSELEQYLGTECYGVGKITDIGFKSKRVKRQIQNGFTLLLTNVMINDRTYIDHIWVNYEGVNDVRIGDIIRFTTNIIQYTKRGSRPDWRMNDEGVLIRKVNDYGFDSIWDIHTINNEIINKNNEKMILN